MPIVKKVTVGIRPIKKLFRVSSLGGATLDAILDARDERALPADFFTSAYTSSNNLEFRLINEDRTNLLIVNTDNIIYTRDFYSGETHFSFDDFLKTFRAIWEALDSVLRVRNIRRIGFVTEHRFKATDQSKRLVEALTKLKYEGYPDKFNLMFESRNLVEGKVPDREKGEFINVIRQFYDSSHDEAHPDDGCLNVNLDVQKYYAPVFNGRISDELLKLHNKEYSSASKSLFEQIRKLGLLDAEEN